MQLIEETVDLAKVNQLLGRQAESKQNFDVIFSDGENRLDEASARGKALLTIENMNGLSKELSARAQKGAPLAKIRAAIALINSLNVLQSGLIDGSIPQGNSSVSKVKRLKVKLIKALDLYSKTALVIRKVTAALKLQDPEPQSFNLPYAQAARAITALAIWEERSSGIGTVPWAREYAAQILNNYKQGKKLTLALYVCPPVDFSMLGSESPELYFGTQVSGGVSFLSGQSSRLAELTSICKRFGVEFDLQVVVGDRDEEAYLWPVLDEPENLPGELVAERKARLKGNVEKYLLKKLGIQKTSLRVLSLSELTQERCADTLEVLRGEVLSQESGLLNVDLELELERMRELWQETETGNCPYYQGLPLPDDKQLREIVLLKFISYAEEGLLFSSLPATAGSVLIQAEKPPRLRTKMLNAGRRLYGKDLWPALYLNTPEE